jgi:hypothetical protein
LTFGAALKPLRPYWTLVKAERQTSAALYAHPLGVELRIDVGELVMWRTEVHRNESDADESARLWCEKFKLKGWIQEGPK